MSGSSNLGPPQSSWRPLTKVIVGVQVLFVVWIVSTSNSGSTCTDSLYPDACRQGEDIGRGLGVMFIIFIWALVDVILGVVWVVTNKDAGKQTPAIPPAPAGMMSLRCPRCNAIQNVPLTDRVYECWQCKQHNSYAPTPEPHA